MSYKDFSSKQKPQPGDKSPPKGRGAGANEAKPATSDKETKGAKS